MNDLERSELSHKIIGCAMEVHKTLGPGLLESAYNRALMCELSLQGLNAVSEFEIPIYYKGNKLNTTYRADIIVEDEIIVELKATEQDNPLYARQLLTYLRITNKKIGLLINFNKHRLIEGVERVANYY